MDPFEVFAHWDSWSPNLTLTLTLIEPSGVYYWNSNASVCNCRFCSMRTSRNKKKGAENEDILNCTYFPAPTMHTYVADYASCSTVSLLNFPQLAYFSEVAYWGLQPTADVAYTFYGTKIHEDAGEAFNARM